MAVTATATTASATITTVANTITTTAVSRDAVTVPRSPNVTHSTASSKLDYSNSAAALLINEISAANDKNDDAQNQQKPEAVAETSTANSKPLNVLNESTSISFSPINELTIGLKRTLSDDILVSDKIKKSKLTVDNSNSNEKIEVSTLIHRNNPKENDIKVLNKKPKNINTIKESSHLNKIYDSSVSNEIPKNNSVKDIPDNQNHNNTNDISSDNHNVYSPYKTSICKKVDDKNQSSNIFINTSTCGVEIISAGSVYDSENDDDVNDNSSLLNSSCSDKLVIVENSDLEDADNISQFRDKIESNVNETSKTESIQGNLPEIFHSYSRTNNQNENLMAGAKDIEDVESDSNSESTNQNVELILDEKDVQNVLNGISEMADNDFPYLLKCFNDKNMTFTQFESICTQKMLEVMTEKLGNGRHRKELQMILEREKIWRTKFSTLNRQCKELKTIVSMHMNDLRNNPNAKPHVITRTVGLQAVLTPKKDSSVQSSKVNIASTSVQQHEEPSEAIDITSDDENDVIVLDKIKNPKPSCSKNVECATNTTPIKQKPRITNELPIKSVPPAVPINEDNTVTIDLTEDDDIEVSNGVSLDKSPIKIVRQTTLNPGVSPGTLPAQLTAKPPHILPKNITYIEIPNLSNSSYIGNTQIANATSLSSMNRDPHKRSIFYKVVASNLVQQPVNVGQTLKPVQVGSTLKSVQVQRHSLNPVIKSVKPGVAFTTRPVSASKSNGTLQPVPPAIPIEKHPAPLPNPPLQRNVPTSKKIPPAPRMTLAKSPDSKALVLSWNMSLNNTHAEISGYQIFAYKESPTDIPRSDLWKEIGNVNALPLPMACSLTKFVAGERYHFAVRAKDVYSRVGPFSVAHSIYSSF